MIKQNVKPKNEPSLSRGLGDVYKRQNVFREKKTEVRSQDGHIETRVQNFRDLSLENGVDVKFRLSVVLKSVSFLSLLCNYLVSVLDQLWALNMT